MKRRRVSRRAVLALSVAAAVAAGAGVVRARAWAARSPDTLRPMPADLPPLPPAPHRLARAGEMVSAAYEFAARHPEVVRHLPCYCGCEKMGHGSNHDCFVAGRDGQGRVRWDEHAMVCGICIDVAWKAREMHARGAALKEILQAVELDLGAERHSRTHTALPPES
jgi:hypothetical protein